MTERLRIGIDVGGTFTKAVAVEPRSLELRAHGAVLTTHESARGVAEGVAEALRIVLAELGDRADTVELVAFSTTQAMNALLEGDVARVGVVGIAAKPDLRLGRKRTRVGKVSLAPGRALETVHVFLDATGGLAVSEVDAALMSLVEAGCTAIASSGAFAVDTPQHECLVAERGRALGLPVCAGHELTGTYGLETRTVTAAVNASILPTVDRTARVVETALAEAGLDVPLLVLRGDGGAMTVESFRQRPSFTVGSGPAAGVAAALHQLGIADGVVLECGGTSSNVSVISRGRPVLRQIKVMGRPTSVRAIDSWVVGAAGGSMARLGRRGIAETGPRSAHRGGLPYACFAHPVELAGAELELVTPQAGDPGDYVAVRAGGRLHALTATCAANALGLVPEGAHASASQEAAVEAFGALGRRLRCSAEEAASRFLTGAVEKIAAAVDEAAREHRLAPDAPVVALGGAGDVLAPEVARRVGRPLLRPEHPEVLSSIGTALSLLRVEVTRTSTGETRALEVAREAERMCADAGAAPDTISVETSFDAREGIVRSVATGALALEADAASREPVDDDGRLAAAARALRIDAGALSVFARNGYYCVYSENGSGRVAVVDQTGGVPLADDAKRIISGRGEEFVERLTAEIDRASVNLGVAALLPRVSLVAGPRILDLSDARGAAEVVETVRDALAACDDDAVAVVAR